MATGFCSRMSFSTAMSESEVGTPGAESRVSISASLKGLISPPTLTPPMALISSMARVMASLAPLPNQ